MILKALYDYYHRCGDLAPTGMEYKEISFLIVIDGNGHFVDIEDVRTDDKKHGTRYLVVKGVRSGTTPKPYCFWDNVEYTCNFVERKAKTTEDEYAKLCTKAAAKHTALQDKFAEIATKHPENSALKAVCDFYANGGLEQVYVHHLWQEISKKPTVNISFRVNGSTTIVAEEPCLAAEAGTDEEKSAGSAVCLITGQKCQPVETTTPTPVPGSQAIARLVSFQVNSGYDSYGKQKGLNAPISKEAEASYTTALNRLTSKGSHNRFNIGNRTFVFWASSESEAAKAMEDAVAAIFDSYSNDDEEADDKADNPDNRIEAVRKVFNAIFSGHLPAAADDRFYILGLAPNVARIALVYWNETKLTDFAALLMRHIDDMEIIDTRANRTPYSGLYQILRSVTLKGKVSDVQPNLPEAVLKSIIQGTPYPYSLMLKAIQRIRAEHSVGITRAAIIKAYLNRINPSNPITTMLDKTNNNIGYLCGRLFAVLEYTQTKASGINTITERYLNTASTSPVSVFPTLLNLSVHHIEKIASKGTKIFIDQLKSQIVGLMPSEGFPAQLDLNDQGRFMVGYYHQKSDFYAGRDNSPAENETNESEK